MEGKLSDYFETILSNFASEYKETSQEVLSKGTRSVVAKCLESKKNSVFPRTLEARPESKEKVTEIPETERKKFVARLMKERQEREDKQRQKLAAKMLKEQEATEKAQKDKIFEEEQKKIDRHNKLLEKHKEFDEAKKVRMIERKKGQNEFKKIVKVTPLYRKVNDEYLHKVELPELQKKKEILAEKRKLMAPLSLNDLKSHAQNYKLKLNERKMKKIEELQKRRRSLEAKREDMNYYQSNAKRKIEEEEIERLKYQKKLKKDRLNLIYKRKEYGMNATKAHKPKHTLKKKIVSENSSKSKFLTPRISAKKPFIPHRKLPNRVKALVSPCKTEEDTNTHNRKNVDYIQEMRTAREIRSQNITLSKLEWREIIENEDISIQEKLNRIQEKTKKFEKKAQNFENILIPTTIGSERSLGTNEMMANAYLDSIQAKLAMLHRLNH